MRIFLYEYVTGGGWWGEDPGAPPSGSLLAEGSAMIRALAADFLALPAVQVAVLRDSRLASFDVSGAECIAVGSADEELATIKSEAARSDYSLLIAPEWNGELLRRAKLVHSTGRPLLSPSPVFIELASDKHLTAEYLRSQGVPAPEGVLIDWDSPLPHPLPFNAVLKPRHGAGSCGIRFMNTPEDLATDETRIEHGQKVRVSSAIHPWLLNKPSWRLERYHLGTAASTAVLRGPTGHLILPGCYQHLSEDGHFTYLGGTTPLEHDLNIRAHRLAEACLAVLPPATGYIGFDLVLGNDPSGCDDVVIEVNPRLTTSYVGLRALCRENLAAAMLAVAGGRPVELSFWPGPIEFRANGEVA